MGEICRTRMTWLSAAEGGRRIPFGGLSYRARGYYEELDPERSKGVFCDTAFYFDGPQATGVRDMCWVTIHSDWVPADLLRTGRVVEVYEGWTLVARCEILGGGNDCIGITAD